MSTGPVRRGPGVRRLATDRRAPVVAMALVCVLDAVLLLGSGLQDPAVVWGVNDVARWELVLLVLLAVTAVVAASPVPLVNAWAVLPLSCLLLGADLLWPAYFHAQLPFLGYALTAAWPCAAAAFALRFPRPRLTRGERRWVAAAALLVPLQVLETAGNDPARAGLQEYLDAWWTAAWPLQVHDRVVYPLLTAAHLTVLAGTLVLLLRRRRRARGASRTGAAVMAGAAGAVLVLSAPTLLWYLGAYSDNAPGRLWPALDPVLALWGDAYFLCPAVLALGATAELAGRRRAEALVAEDLLAAAATDGPGPRLDGALRRCLGDPTARVVVTDGAAVLDVDETAGWAGDRILASAARDAATVGLRHRDLLVRRQASVVELARSRARVVEAALAERRAVERDLHDGAQQALLGVSAVLARADLVDDVALPDLVDQALLRLDGVDGDISRLVGGLRPAELALGGLAGALPALAAGAGIDVRLSMPDGTDPFPAAVEAAAYFVVAEALANAVRHAAARTVEVSLTTAGGAVEVVVRDDGRGGAAAVPGGGLAGLAERLAGLGGRLEVGAAPGGGSLVAARIPADGGHR